MDKATLMRAYKAMVSNASGMSMSESCQTCVPPLRGLTRLDVREAYVRTQQLNKEICFQGRVMYANICNSTSLPTNQMVLCLVEQEADDGSSAGGAFLHVFNATYSSQENGDLLFPREARVAIKEPLCFSSVMQVSSPASIEFLGLTKEARFRPVESLIKEASMLRARGSLVLADLYYTEALNKLANRDPALRKEALVNRSETRLLLGRHEESVMDAEAALKVNDKYLHARTLWSKSKALTALQEHELALTALETAASEPDAPAEVSEDVRKSKRSVLQSVHGRYDISEYLLQKLDSKYAPECSDYVGPLEMRLTPDGRGRGLYLTQDVEPGHLLLVCNPLTYARSDEDELVELVRICMSSDRRLRQMYAMADAPDMKAVSDFTPFKCNVGKVVQRREDTEFDIPRLGRVSGRNGFKNKSDGVTVSGLWTSPAFINHSCLPTVSRVMIGKVMFVRAAKSLKAGDEAVFTYTEDGVLSPLSKREKLIRDLAFECKCKRCLVERKHRQLLESFKYDPNASVYELHRHMQEWALDVEGKLTMGSFAADEKDWVRAGLVDLYSAVGMVKHPRLPSVSDYLKILHKTGAGTLSTFARMAYMYHLYRCGPECLELLRANFVVLFGNQSDKVFNAAMSKYKLNIAAFGK